MNQNNQFDKDEQMVTIKTILVILFLLGVSIFTCYKVKAHEEMNEDTFHLVPYPSLETTYGYHVQNWKPYSVVFYDSEWNVVEDPLYIKRRKLFKK